MKEKRIQENHRIDNTETEYLKEKKNIRCRFCFIVDGYTNNEKKCKHCGSRLFDIDRY